MKQQVELSEREREAVATLSKEVGVLMYAYKHGGMDYYNARSSTDLSRLWAVIEEHKEEGTQGVFLGIRTNGPDGTGRAFDALSEEAYNARCNHPWAKAAFWRKGVHIWGYHLPNASAKHPGLLSYYQSEAKRAQDIRTPIKPGRYLRKFFSDVLSEDEIQSLGIEWQTWATPPELKVTADADVIEEVYVNGPHSCMKYAADHFDGYCHPARVYAGPDLAVAYIGEADEAAARCVVWPERKVYSRIYGDHHRMRSALETAGYTEGDLDGARIRRLWDNSQGAFVVPYVDGCDNADDDGTYLTLGSGGVYCQRTNGLSEEGGVGCGSCEERVDNDDAMTTGHGATYCPSCYHERFFTCDATGESECERDEALDGPGGERYGPNADVFFCDATELHYPRSRRYSHYRTYESVEMANGETWEARHFASHGFTCCHDEENYPNDELVHASNGDPVQSDNLEAYEEWLCENAEAVEAIKRVREEARIEAEKEPPRVRCVGVYDDLPDGDYAVLKARDDSDHVLIQRTDGRGHDGHGTHPQGGAWFVHVRYMKPLNPAAEAMLASPARLAA